VEAIESKGNKESQFCERSGTALELRFTSASRRLNSGRFHAVNQLAKNNQVG
jgi:hypothetical protein